MQRLPQDKAKLNNSHHNPDYLLAAYKVIDSVVEILEEWIQESLDDPVEEESHPQIIRSFSSRKHPTISILDYLKRIVKYTKPEPSTIIISLVYIDKIVEITNMQLTPNNIHRVIWACIVVALKYNEDDYFSNAYYAKVGGIGLAELNTLEYYVIKILDFNTFVNDEIYNGYETNWNLDMDSD